LEINGGFESVLVGVIEGGEEIEAGAVFDIINGGCVAIERVDGAGVDALELWDGVGEQEGRANGLAGLGGGAQNAGD
jgi:hypothetical protein